MKIRECGPLDHDGLLECLSVFGETKFESPSALAKLARLHEERRRKGINTFVADGGGVVVGTYSVIVEPKFIHGGCFAAHIEDVAVHADWQGRGVGRALMEHAIEFCRAAGCYKIVLYCAPETVPFYEKVGFYSNGIGMRFDLDKEKD